jgi:hypothetical protein
VGVVKGALIVDVVSVIPRRNHIIYLVQPIGDQTIGGGVIHRVVFDCNPLG